MCACVRVLVTTSCCHNIATRIRCVFSLSLSLTFARERNFRVSTLTKRTRVEATDNRRVEITKHEIVDFLLAHMNKETTHFLFRDVILHVFLWNDFQVKLHSRDQIKNYNERQRCAGMQIRLSVECPYVLKAQPSKGVSHVRDWVTINPAIQ